MRRIGLAIAALVLTAMPVHAQSGAQQRSAATVAVIAAAGAAADDLLAEGRLQSAQRAHLADVRAEQARTARALRARDRSEQESRRLRARLDELDAQVLNLVDAARAQGLIHADQQRQIDFFTQSILGEAEAADPVKLQCLEDFGRGVRAEAFPCIRDINAARVRARDAAAAAVQAAQARADADDLRQTAFLASQMQRQGELPLAEVIGHWEDVAARSTRAWDAIELSRLYLRAGRRAESLALIERALAEPVEGRVRRALLGELGWALELSGNIQAALSAYGESVGIARALAEADDGNAQARRDLSVSLGNLGGVYLRLNRTGEALSAYVEGEGIARALAETYAGDAQIQHDLSISLSNLGGVYLHLSRTDEALSAYRESAGIRRALAADAGNAEARRDLGGSLNSLGNTYLRLNRTGEALSAYGESVGIARALAEADDGNAQARRDLSVSLSNLGDVYLRLNRTGEALSAYGESEGIRRALATDDGNAQAQTDLLYSQVRLCSLRQPGACEALRQHAAGVEARGWLTPEQAADIRNLVSENAP